jgi:hypothetical protein
MPLLAGVSETPLMSVRFEYSAFGQILDDGRQRDYSQSTPEQNPQSQLLWIHIGIRTIFFTKNETVGVPSHGFRYQIPINIHPQARTLGQGYATVFLNNQWIHQS